VSTDIDGNVKSVYVDKANHAELIVIYSSRGSDHRLNLSYDVNHVHQIIRPGMAIRKGAGSAEVRLSHSTLDTVVVVDFGCSPRSPQ
jgi:hypothetical protein